MLLGCRAVAVSLVFFFGIRVSGGAVDASAVKLGCLAILYLYGSFRMIFCHLYV